MDGYALLSLVLVLGNVWMVYNLWGEIPEWLRVWSEILRVFWVMAVAVNVIGYFISDLDETDVRYKPYGSPGQPLRAMKSFTCMHLAIL